MLNFRTSHRLLFAVFSLVAPMCVAQEANSEKIYDFVEGAPDERFAECHGGLEEIIPLTPINIVENPDSLYNYNGLSPFLMRYKDGTVLGCAHVITLGSGEAGFVCGYKKC